MCFCQYLMISSVLCLTDYEPLQFVLPTRPNETVHVTYDPASLTFDSFDIPVCVVYSSIELNDLTTVAGEMGELDHDKKKINDLYITLIGNKLINGTYSCTAETKWQISQINYIITFVQSMGSGKQLSVYINLHIYQGSIYWGEASPPNQNL